MLIKHQKLSKSFLLNSFIRVKSKAKAREFIRYIELNENQMQKSMILQFLHQSLDLDR